MGAIFTNLQSGTLSADPGGAGVTLNSAAFANLPTVAAPDTLTLTLDPDAALGSPEIVLCTTHTAANTALTVTRAQEGTAGIAHAIGTVWRAASTRLHFEELPFRKVTTKGDLIAGTAVNAVARLAAGANDTRLVADSAQASGLRYAPDTELKLVAAKGDLVAGTANDTIAVLTVGSNDTRLVADSSQATGLRYAPDTELKLVAAKGDLLVGTANDTVAVKSVGADGTFLLADAASAGGVKWNAGALTTWSPAYTQGGANAVTIQHATLQRVGRRVTATSRVTVNGASGTPNTLITLTLPIAGVAAADGEVIGFGHFVDASTGFFFTFEVLQTSSGTVCYFLVYAQGGVTPTAFQLGNGTGGAFLQMGLSTGDILSANLSYEAAAD